MRELRVDENKTAQRQAGCSRVSRERCPVGGPEYADWSF